MNKICLVLCVAVSLVKVTALNGAEQMSYAVDFPQGDAKWSVVYRSAPQKKPDDDKLSAKIPQRIDIVRQGDLRRDVITFTDGSTTRLWWSENPPVALFADASGGHVSAMRASYLALRRFDTESFSWVAEKTFMKDVAELGRECQYYEMEVVEDFGAGLEKRILRAWIDKKTQRPVELDNGQARVTFEFPETPGVEALDLPAMFRTKLKQYQEFYAPPRKAQ